MVRAVPRDLFPLPPGRREDVCSATLGRTSAKRVGKRRACFQRVSDCIDGLHWLYGDERGFVGARPSEAQEQTLSFITDSVFADCPPSDWREAPQESLEAILGTRAGAYRDDGPDSIRMAPLAPDSVIAWPTRAGSAELVKCLPESQADFLREGRSSLGRPVEEFDRLIADQGRSSVFWDPLLRRSRPAYLAFVKELLQRNMANLQLSQPLSEVGIFFVYKKTVN